MMLGEQGEECSLPNASRERVPTGDRAKAILRCSELDATLSASNIGSKRLFNTKTQMPAGLITMNLNLDADSWSAPQTIPLNSTHFVKLGVTVVPEKASGQVTSVKKPHLKECQFNTHGTAATAKDKGDVDTMQVGDEIEIEVVGKLKVE
ncbi:uncharacterized protein UTRI_06739 [Ustilago trichophora]|uniref:Uncharacterized protein n=1 Tax=Ustilago trichophora TaxID=86804 RepID=A0A5C3EN08_9BASI|nr:uncharacterized protein UTRI_06739 [Ustilago trichophora]